MHDEATDGRTEAFLEELRSSFCVPEAPAPGPALSSLFASLADDKGDLPVTAGSNANRSARQMAGLPNRTRRRIDMMKESLSQLGTKIAAGAAGAGLIMGGLGTAGVGPVSLIGHDDAEQECVELDELAETFDEDIVVCEVGEESEGDGETLEDGDVEVLEEGDVEELSEHVEGDLPPEPTTTSEAAQIHAFDEACGNHGMYVSFFAQMGFEPPCALLARAGEEPDEEMTRQERKKAALELRKECKARAKAGDPCTAEEFTPTDGEEEVSTPSDSEGEEELLTSDSAVAEADDPKGNGNGKGHGEAKAKAKDNKTKGKSGERGARGRR